MAANNLICVVDDQADYRFLLQKLFYNYLPAYPVYFFDSGYALFDELIDMNPKPGLILLDRHMPHLDGHQTLLTLKGNSVYKKIPVVMMSGDATALEINDCYEAGGEFISVKKAGFPIHEGDNRNDLPILVRNESRTG